MTRIEIDATITGEIADVFALHPAVAAATTDGLNFTVTDTALLVTVADADLPAVLAVLAPASPIGQITFAAAEAPLAA